MLRSPKGRMLSQMYQFQNIYDLSTLSQHHYNLLVLLMSIAGNSTRPESNYGMNGIMQHLFPDGSSAVEELQQYGLVEKVVPFGDALGCQTVPKLKNILRGKGLKVSGNSDELLERLRPVWTADEEKTLGDSILVWRPTTLGFEYIRSLYAERESMEKSALEAFLARDYTRGADIIYKYQVRFPACDVINNGGSSFSTYESGLLTRFFTNRRMDMLSAIACFHYLSGNMMFPPSISGSESDIQIKHELEIRYIVFSILSVRSLESYQSAGIVFYKVKSARDEKTCERCRNLNGKIYKVEEAKFGENFPPFHLGCRCCTGAIIKQNSNP